MQGESSIGPEEEAVLDALARIDELRRSGLGPDRIAEAMAAEAAPVPAGGRWTADKVERIIGVFDSLRQTPTSPQPAVAPESVADPEPGPISAAATAATVAGAPAPAPALATTAPAPVEPTRRGRAIGVAGARWALISLFLAGLGAGGYLLIDAVAGTSPSSTRSTDEARADTSMAVTTTVAPDPADTMAIRIETDQSDRAESSTSDEPAPATATIRSDGLLYIEGAFATAADADLFLREAGEVFGSENIVEDFIVDPAAPAPKVADIALDKPVLFESGTAVIDPDYIEFLEACAGVLALNPQIVMSITAYTDSLGSDEFNLALSQQRAQAIVDFYRDRQIGDDQLVALGLGEADPAAPNDTDEGRSRNRRAMLELLNVVGDQAADLE